jgi:hypothetical protein
MLPALFSWTGACVKRLTRMSTPEKFLAWVCVKAEARESMKPTTSSRAHAFLAALAGLAFAWTLALSVSPQLHERVHADANRVEHSCAVTFIASGSYDHSAPAPLITAAVPAVQFSKISALAPQWVESPFVLASIFEHAPPALA